MYNNKIEDPCPFAPLEPHSRGNHVWLKHLHISVLLNDVCTFSCESSIKTSSIDELVISADMELLLLSSHPIPFPQPRNTGILRFGKFMVFYGSGIIIHRWGFVAYQMSLSFCFFSPGVNDFFL